MKKQYHTRQRFTFEKFDGKRWTTAGYLLMPDEVPEFYRYLNQLEWTFDRAFERARLTMFDSHDELAIALALYHWLQHNWIGMDDKYKAYCTLTDKDMFKPSPRQEFFESIDPEAMEVYESLTDDNYDQAMQQVIDYVSKG